MLYKLGPGGIGIAMAWYRKGADVRPAVHGPPAQAQLPR
jgi:hypothetical protein